jgi:hypothetical protein
MFEKENFLTMILDCIVRKSIIFHSSKYCNGGHIREGKGD